MEEILKEMLSKLNEIDKNQKRIEMKMEQRIEPKIQALCEDRDIVHSKLDTIQNKVDNLAQKVEKQEVEIKVIKGGKKSKAK